MESHLTSARLIDPERGEALRSEREMLAPIAIEIEAMQKRAARAQARLATRQTLNIQTAHEAIGMLVDEMLEVASDIEFLMDGQIGLGPAIDCRLALQNIRTALPALQRDRIS